MKEKKKKRKDFLDGLKKNGPHKKEKKHIKKKEIYLDQQKG